MKQFILVPSIDEEHHCIPIERIISVEYEKLNHRNSRIMVSNPDETFYSKLKVKEVYNLIQEENYRL